MIIAIVDFEVAAQNRAKALNILAKESASAAARPGNLGYRAFTNAGSQTHVGLMHQWDDLPAFTAYIGSPIFAEIGAKLRPMMISPPISQRLNAEVFEEVRG